MKKFLQGVCLMSLLTLFSGCAGQSIETYANKTPKTSIKEYFNGNIQAWGIVQNWKGEVTRKFDVQMVGSWEGNTGTLKEHFVYDDGEKQSRTWTITQLPNGEYEGRASDILDKAVGRSSGDATRWNYAMNLKVGDSTYYVRFDDWMWQLDQKTLMNRSYIKKFGITVAELTIFMQKK